MGSTDASRRPKLTRRSLLKAGALGAASLALYSGEIARLWIDETRHDVYLPNLPAAFDGVRIVQLSDIHLDEFTEPFFLRSVVEQVNRIAPDYVFVTGDFVTAGLAPPRYARAAAGQCAELLRSLACQHRYCSLGNHDHVVGAELVTEALTAHGATVLRNAFVPLERDGARLWLAGLDDPVEGRPDPDSAIPTSIRNQSGEPVIALCHAPDYADTLLAQPAGRAIDLVLSGHTHGGQVRLPFVGALPATLPQLGRRYIEGAFHFGRMQLYVNRGVGTVGVPFRFNCPPEIATFTLRSGVSPAPATPGD